MDKVTKTISAIQGADAKLMAQAQHRLDNLTKPQGSLGELEVIAKRIVGITGSMHPALTRKLIFTLAADHGVTEEKISAFPKEVTAQMVYNFLTGGAGINVLARHAGAKVVVVDMGVAEKLKVQGEESKTFKDKKVGYGTKNFTKEPAMTPQEAIKSLTYGIEAFEEELENGIDIVGIGEMGIGNTTSASAITACITKASVAQTTGKGTGIADKELAHKIAVIEKALRINTPDPKDAIDVLAKVGGFEIGGMAGIILAAAANKVPVVIDGFISSASALLAFTLEPKVADYLIASHSSMEQGHRIILQHIGVTPFLDLHMRLGEGTGAALAMGIIDAAIKILDEMATFESAGVSKKD
ncbi:MAG: nicotinate-nucleotide--dimethylbenzimidazole phosphoribosyltransferase [Candidatus Omnitrophica bacterium]|nr:nicotinate-nucleotide--dimethylbenzimidazole phosphoribosyltransferase [Candidatus Omnitrophota bacterium]